MLTDTVLTRIPLLFDVPLTFLFFVLGAAIGRRVLSRVSLAKADTLERGLFAVTLGMGTLAFLPFLLFAIHLGRPVFVAGTALLLMLAFLRDEIYVVQKALRLLRNALAEGKNGLPGPAKLLLVLTVPLLGLSFLLACCPPTDPDGLHYHLTAPARYLAQGGFHYIPTILQINWPLGVEMLFGLGMAFNAHYAAALIQYGFGLLLLVSTFALGKRLASPLVGWFAAVLLLFWTRGEFSWAYVDVGVAQYALMALYAFLIGLRNLNAEENAFPARLSAASPWFLLTGAFAGLMACAKLPGIFTLVLLSAQIFGAVAKAAANSDPGSAKGKLALRPALGCFLLGAALAVPWYLRTWVLTGDPFYPLLWKIFHPVDWNAVTNQRMNLWIQVFTTLPSRNLSPEQVFLLRAVLSAVILSFGILAGFLPGSKPMRPVLFFVIVSAFLQVATSSIYLRYFFPIFAPILLLAFWSLRNVLSRLPTLTWTIAALIGIAVWGLNRLPANLREFVPTVRATLPVALGLTSRDTYLSGKLPIYPALRRAEAELPKDAVVVYGVWYDAFPSLLDRRPLYTSPWLQGAINCDDWDSFLNDLRRLGATHLILSEDNPTGDIAALKREEQLRMRIEFPKVQRLRRQYGTPLYSLNGYTVYTLKLSP